MLKDIIEKLTSIYNEYGDIDVCKNGECGGVFTVYANNITVENWVTPDGDTEKVVEI